MRLIVTRPAAQAADWVRDLRAAGIDAVALPLIGIEPVAPDALAAAWHGLARHRLVVFVSPNAVERFFAARPADCAWPTTTLAGAPGPGTAAALRVLGVAAGQVVEPPADAPAFDSDALWQVLAGRSWVGRSALLVRGDGGRETLASHLSTAGARVEAIAAYRRVAPRLDAAGTALLRDAIAVPAAHNWFFSSSEAVDRLAELTGGPAGDAPAVGGVPADPQWRRGARAIATHPRIAATARAAGFGRVDATRPGRAAVIACIQSPRP